MMDQDSAEPLPERGSEAGRVVTTAGVSADSAMATSIARRLAPRLLAAAGAMASLVAIAGLLTGCGGDRDAGRKEGPGSPSGAGRVKSASPSPIRPYEVSANGGTAATGPGDRFNHCERIWCLTHRENFFIDHYRKGHVGWILHDDSVGDVFSPSMRAGGPKLPDAKLTVLHLCGSHFHPHLLGRGAGAVRGGMYAPSVGYSRQHWRSFGTQLEPCCINGLGWDYIHSRGVGRFFRFHDLDDYREHPERGWQKPFVDAALATR